jgi:hypothetical protein
MLAEPVSRRSVRPVSNILLDGDLASWQVRFTGTNSAGVAPACLVGLPSAQTGLLRWSLVGMPPTGATIDVTSLHLGRLDRDRLIEHWKATSWRCSLSRPSPSGHPLRLCRSS